MFIRIVYVYVYIHVCKDSGAGDHSKGPGLDDRGRRPMSDYEAPAWYLEQVGPFMI